MTVKGSQELVRRLNHQLILDAIRRHGEISRADIARETGLTTGTVSNLCTSLLESGLIEEVGLGSSNGGRKPVMLRLRGSARYALGVQVQVEEVTALLVDLTGRPSRVVTEPLQVSPAPEAVVDVVARLVQQVLHSVEVSPDALLGAGVALPATVDPEHGMLFYAPNLRWWNVPMGPLLQGRLGMAVLIENDANAAAFGEYWTGATRGLGNSVFVYADYGIGSGFLIGGEIYRGRNQAAGEFGHTTIDVAGPQCHCGNRGCLGTLASGRSIIRRIGSSQTLAEIIQAARDGDAACLEAIREAATYLGAGIANLINLFNPDSLVIGGKLALEAPGYWETAAQAAAERLFPALHNQVNLTRSLLGQHAPAIGAASLVMRQLFRPLRISANT